MPHAPNHYPFLSKPRTNIPNTTTPKPSHLRNLLTTSHHTTSHIIIIITLIKRTRHIRTWSSINISPILEDASLAVYEDEREMILTYVSAFGLQRQSIKINKGQVKRPNHQDIILNEQNYKIKQY